MTLTEFLLARLDEDEACVIHLDCVCAEDESLPGCPDRVLAECEATRRIVVDFQHYQPHDPEYDGLKLYVEILASVYADHPDYRQEWAV